MSANKKKFAHTPVMLQEVLQSLRPGPNKTFIDYTFGRGGHALELMRYGSNIIALDRDIHAVQFGQKVEAMSNKLKVFHALFSESQYVTKPHTMAGALFDLGVSSPQLDDLDFGLSFNSGQKLSMNMGKSKLSAYQVINNYSKEIMQKIFLELGEEKYAPAIAKAVVDRRAKSKIETNIELAEVIRAIIPRQGKDPATKVFQALRMYVNDELGELVAGLNQAKRLVRPGGIIAVLSFHSLEDRLVKQFFRSFYFKSEVILPSKREAAQNPRAKSAKLRWGLVL